MSKLFEAMYYTKHDDTRVTCHLCPNLCTIAPKGKGKCRVRVNKEGKLYTTNYGLSTSGSKDPIEKKPLYHFLPGTCAYSFGTVGCNLFCEFCQNYHISRATPDDYKYGLHYLSPESAVNEVIKSDCPSVAYTYNEPIIWYEWVLNTSKLMKKKGIKNILVTNGYIEEEPLRELLPYIDAANVDLKGDSPFYKELCKVSHQEAVLRTCEIMKENNVHLEITNLIVTSKNDSKEQLQELIDFIVTKLDVDVPLHFSRYFPHYKLDLPATPVDTLIQAREMALKAGLNYVYLGNVRDADHSNTHCKKCGELLVNRVGYFTKTRNLTDDKKCKNCGTPTDFIWN